MVYQNCGVPFKLANQQSDSFKSACRPSGKGSFSESKVQLSPQTIHNAQEGYSAQKGKLETLEGSKVSMSFDLSKPTAFKAADEILAGTRLNVLIDLVCVKNLEDVFTGGSGLSDSEFYFSLNLRTLSSSPVDSLIAEAELDRSPVLSHEKAVEIVLRSSMTFSEISELAKKDRCLVGITESVPRFVPSLVWNDPKFPQQTFHSAIESQAGVNSFLSDEISAAGYVTVAIIDSGVDWNHTDLEQVNRSLSKDMVSGRSLQGRPEMPLQSGSVTESILNTFFHGTHVAGLIGATIGNSIGVAGVGGPRVNMVSYNGLKWSQESGEWVAHFPDDVLYNAIIEAAKTSHIINMSLGVTYPSGFQAPSLLKEAVDKATAANRLVITAAGNGYVECQLKPSSTCSQALKRANMDSTSEPREYPAYFAKTNSKVIAVGSTDQNPIATTNLSSFSNYGPSVVEISAPGSGGEGIWSTAALGLKNGQTPIEYYPLSGTSMATPQVSGAAALAWGYVAERVGSENVKADEIKKWMLLYESNDHSAKLESYFKNGSRINIKKLYSSIKYQVSSSGNPGTTTPTPTAPTGPTPEVPLDGTGFPSIVDLPTCP